ncbi:armadillo repeat-containing protein 6-like [Zingiber officinale]|uniref:armadillo repeat-containing protein 6-like n=1 Tax=Zingiber officinale TaxID=94328 RepID=UPI001C4DB2D4|nr:armadillo repeat-containing protein 6-like [Zingiber officinale]
MGPSAGGRTISQEAFEALVAENMDDLGMDPEEALEDALQTLTLQGVDLSGIIKCIPGVSSTRDNPLIQILDKLKDVAFSTSNTSKDNAEVEEIVELLDKFYGLCSVEGTENATIASRNGGVELLTRICSSFDVQFETTLVLAMKALSSILHDAQSREIFQQNGGPKVVADMLSGNRKNPVILDSSFSVVVAASTNDEILKESFMELKIDELILQILKEQPKDTLYGLYDAIRVLLTPDDTRVLASQVYGYARRFAKLGIADALVKALCDGLSSPILASACIALKAVAVNDEICKSISESGGIDAILQCLDQSTEQNDKTIARVCCSLLSKLAGSDTNKTLIVEKGGLNCLMKLSSRFSEDPLVLQEIMSIITVLSLRSPENAASAVEAGVADFVLHAMQKFPTSYQLQRQACFMIRNLVVRNPENRIILLGNGIEKLIRKAKVSHASCKDAATAALRDLGLDDYNT